MTVFYTHDPDQQALDDWATNGTDPAQDVLEAEQRAQEATDREAEWGGVDIWHRRDDRFWAHVLGELPYECWIWTAQITPDGYGRWGYGFGGAKKSVCAHRYAYERLIEPIPEGLTIDHLCRNRACVNPTHLEPVTMRENVMRGDGLTAANAKKTHCPKGHPYDDENTRYGTNGRRICRTCDREYQRRYNATRPKRRKRAS